MVQLAVTVPDGLVSALIAAVDWEYGDAVRGLTDAQKGKYAIKAHLLDLYRRHQHSLASQAEQVKVAAVRVQAEADIAVVEAARKTAEADAIAAAEAEFDNVT